LVGRHRSYLNSIGIATLNLIGEKRSEIPSLRENAFGGKHLEKTNYAEGVGDFQPRVAPTLGLNTIERPNAEGVGEICAKRFANSYRV
jgi:hypothetical protein